MYPDYGLAAPAPVLLTLRMTYRVIGLVIDGAL